MFCASELLGFIEEFSARWRALKPKKWRISPHYRRDWGIFGSLKSTETCELSFCDNSRLILRNFRLAEEHWNTRSKQSCSMKLWLRNFRLAEEHWNYASATSSSEIRENWGIFGSLKSTETSIFISTHELRENWGIFGSLKSTETLVAGATGATDSRLRNFRLAEEHWNNKKKQIPPLAGFDWGIFGSLKSTETGHRRDQHRVGVALRNFRLAEEHWNLIWQGWVTLCVKLRNFRLAEEHWNLTMPRCVTRLRNIEEFSARWRALKRVALPLPAPLPDHWGIFGSLKSTETQVAVVVAEVAVNWGIFGSLKSTETQR